MAKKLALIPMKTRIAEIQGVYQRAAERIVDILSGPDPATFTSVEHGAALRRIQGIILTLDDQVRIWAPEAIRAAYEESAGVARTRLELIGAKQNRRYNPARHDKKIGALTKTVMTDYWKANRTIEKTAKKFLTLMDAAARGMKRIEAQAQEFDSATVRGFINRTVAASLGAKTKYNAGMAHLTSQSVAAKIRAKLLDQIGGGNFININGRNYNLRSYAELVARTRMRESQTEATKELARQYDNDLVIFSKHDSPCDECAQYEGQVFSLSGDSETYDKLPPEAEPPVHPNCLLPGTKTESPGGFVAGLRARYSGPAVEVIFAKGARVSVTVNHMFLTPRGFAPAHLLREGDDVFCCLSPIGSISIGPHNNEGPAAVEETFASLLKTSGMASGRVPAAAEYLHGDGGKVDGDIDVVGAYSFLRSAIEPSPSQGTKAMKLNGADTGTKALSGKGNLFSMFKRLALTADRIMGGFRSPSPFFLARSGGGDVVAFTDTAKGNPAYDKPTVDILISDFEALRQIAFEKPGLIQTTKVVNVRRFEFTGHVYDLQSPTSLYLGNGILSSNCEHNLNPTSENALAWGRA